MASIGNAKRFLRTLKVLFFRATDATNFSKDNFRFCQSFEALLSQRNKYFGEKGLSEGDTVCVRESERARERGQITLTVGGRITVQLVSSLTSLDMTNKQNMWVTNSFWEHGR